MASKYWIKLYHEILDDPKMGRLPGEVFKQCICLFLLASEYGKDGLLPRVDDMAWRLRVDPEELKTTLAILESVNILTSTEAGWLVTNFQKRQAASEAKERVKAYRDRKRKEKQQSNADDTLYNEESNDSVTESNACNAPDTDTDTDTESLPKGNDGASAPLPPDPIPEKDKGPEKTSELLPDTEYSRLLFEKLKTEYDANHKRAPAKFPSLACKRKFDARTGFLKEHTGEAIDRALQKGILAVTGITDFIAKWDPAREGQQNGHNHTAKPAQPAYQPIPVDASFYDDIPSQKV